MKTRIILTVVILCLMVHGVMAQPLEHPAMNIIKYYQSIQEDEIVVVPRVVSLMALDLLKSDPAAQLNNVKQYILWYMAHLNYADKYDITGSMYDYTVSANGKEMSLKSSDAIPRYAASFLLLLGRYLHVSGDHAFFTENRQKIEDLAYNIPFLQGEEGLIRTFPGQNSVFLEDNCEAYGGLSSIIKISRQMQWKIDEYYLEIRERLANGILTHLYDSKGMRFYREIRNGRKKASEWKQLYPDAYCQLLPLLFDVLNQPRGVFARQRMIKKNLWKRFRRYHKRHIKNLRVEHQLIYKWTEQLVKKGKKLWAITGTKPNARS